MMADTIEGFLCRLSLHLCHILFLPKICVSAEKAVFCTISIAGNWIFLPERAMINFTDDPIPLRWVFFFQDSFLLLFSRGGQLLCKKTALSINDHAPIPFVAWMGWISGGKGKTRHNLLVSICFQKSIPSYASISSAAYLWNGRINSCIIFSMSSVSPAATPS